MSAGLDMSLDEIISKKRPSRSFRGRPLRTSGIVKRSGGPIRNTRPLQTGSRPYGAPSVTTSNVGSAPEGKILVSNLAYKVTEADLWELFTTMIGPVRRVNLNFDKNGRSKGTASVVFQRRADAVRSVEKMRNITLDGREIKIEIVVAPGTNNGANPISQRIGNLQERTRVAPIRGPVTGAPRGGLPTRGGGGGGGGGRGRGGSIRGRGGRRPDNRQKKTQQELDAEIGEYMQIDEQESNQTAIGKQN